MCTGGSPGQRSSPAAATRPSPVGEEGPKPEQADQALRVATVRDHLVEPGQRLLDDLDALVVFGVRGLVVEVGRQVDVALLRRESGRGVEAREQPPAAGALADLLGQLALRRLLWPLPLLVELAGGKLEQRLLADGLARLRHQVELLTVVRYDRDSARVLDDLAIGLLAVVIAEAVHAHRRDLALERGLAADALEGHALPYPALAATMPSVRASVRCSASTVTDSSGW